MENRLLSAKQSFVVDLVKALLSGVLKQKSLQIQ